MYVWHCDRAGRYSLYSSGATNENYLRGVQVTDSSGHTYLDFFCGILTNMLGYDVPEVRDAVERQIASGVVHTSTLYLIRGQVELAHERFHVRDRHWSVASNVEHARVDLCFERAGSGIARVGCSTLELLDRGEQDLLRPLLGESAPPGVG